MISASSDQSRRLWLAFLSSLLVHAVLWVFLRWYPFKGPAEFARVSSHEVESTSVRNRTFPIRLETRKTQTAPTWHLPPHSEGERIRRGKTSDLRGGTANGFTTRQKPPRTLLKALGENFQLRLSDDRKSMEGRLNLLRLLKPLFPEKWRESVLLKVPEIPTKIYE